MSLEDQIRAVLDTARGLSDASLNIQTGQYDAEKIDATMLVDVVVALLGTTKALMDCVVDLAVAVDQLAEHTDYPMGS